MFGGVRMKMNQKGRGNDEFCTPDYIYRQLNLNLAHNTVKGILKNIYAKLNVSGARELIVRHYKGI